MEISDSARRILAGVLEARTGQQLTMNRRWRIDTALAAIMRERGFDTVDQLVSRLVAGRDPPLADQVIEALLNNETYFFRDRLPFDLLLAGPVKRLEQARARERRLSIWCAGCSTGQEAYSLAMSFADEPRAGRAGRSTSSAPISRARRSSAARSGIYSQFEVQRGLPVMQMIRWFEELGGGDWRLAPSCAASVRFELSNITEPPPHPGTFDIILCRNVLLYFAPEHAPAGLQPARRGDRPGRHPDARRRRDGDRPDRALRLRSRVPRPLHPGAAPKAPRGAASPEG